MSESRLPRISIVMPSFNQGQFIEEAMRSVLDQGYPNLELLVLDGGSTDGTLDVLQRYADHLAYWVSEPDRGQAHAINKGFERSTGAILGWLNTDDRLAEGALETAGRTLADDTGAMALVGHCSFEYAASGRTAVLEGRYESRRRLLEYWRGYRMHQPAIFWRREVLDVVGPLDDKLHYGMDYDYWIRIAEHFPFVNVDAVLAHAIVHDDAKTGDDYRAYFRELRTISRRASGLSRAQPRYWWDAAMMTTFDAYRATRQRLNRRAVSRPRPT